ncbi:DUF2809 domain-containing protein [Microbacterium karelineae]|uniref:ribosomal maturation YjgA family protein n=1 Tax=Microbacterium karelineae TaxID=2654283 RepID=UPI0012EAE76B|nr:DUF2809 domain-containing protein [Microbacterium karelineae]
MRRLVLAVAAVVVIAAGLSVHTFAPDGFASDAAGDALYAALIHLLVAFLAPRWPSWRSGSVAVAWCVAIELFQVTGLPAQWGAAFRPLMLVFGTVFSASDLVFYALGIGAAAAVDVIIRCRGRGSRTHRTSGSDTTER